MKIISKIALFCLLSLTLVNCKKDEFVPFNKTEFIIDIQKDRIVDTLYRIVLLDVNSSDDYVLSSAKIKLIINNKDILFDGNWQKLRNFTISLHEHKEFTISAQLYIEKPDERVEISRKTFLLDNIKYPDFIKITKIEVDYDLSTISNLSYNFLTMIQTHYRYEDATLIYNYFKLVQPNLKTYYPYSLNLKTSDKQNGPHWLKYNLTVGYATGSGNTFYEYRPFHAVIDIKEIFEQGNTDPSKTYVLDIPSQTNYDAGFKLTYKCIYEN
jgi:hypothetical protein